MARLLIADYMNSINEGLKVKLQHIKDDGTLVNLHPFGKDLREFLYSEEIFALLEPYGHGWLDGGCWTLAQALQLWSNGTLQLRAVLTVPKLKPSHVVAYLEGIFIDGDGLATAEELLNKMRQLEGVHDCIIGDFSESEANERGIIQCYLPVLKPLVDKLLATFHDFDKSLLDPDEAMSIEEATSEEEIDELC